MLIWHYRRMPVPGSPVAVTAENAGAVEHHRIASDLLAGVDINLDKAVCVDVQPQFDGIIGLVNRFDMMNESPFCRRALNIALDSAGVHSSPRRAAS